MARCPILPDARFSGRLIASTFGSSSSTTPSSSQLNSGTGIATPEYVKEKGYIGASFGVSFLLCTLVVIWLWTRPARTAWIAGALLCAGMILGFLLSRTVGLPGFNESGVWEYWTEGFPALAAELGFHPAVIPRPRDQADPCDGSPDVTRSALADPIARDGAFSSR